MSFFKIFAVVLFFSITPRCTAQNNSDTTRYKRIAAGPEYKRASFYQWLWGTNYRKEWTTPIEFPVTFLDTLKGGIKEFKEGGSHQSRSLHIKNVEGKAYTLRSVDKSLDKVIPKIFHKTFIANIVNDDIITIKELAETIISITGSNSKIIHLPPLKEGDMTKRQPDISKMKELLNRDLLPYEEGIKRIIDVWKKN